MCGVHIRRLVANCLHFLATTRAVTQVMASSPVARRVGIASLIWGVSVFLSRIIGLVREGVLGRVLGGGREADVFLASFILPDFLNYLLAGGALSIVFIPIFSGYLANGQTQKGWEAFSVIANFLLLLLGIATVVLWLATPYLVPIVAPGFDVEQRAQLVLLSRIILPAQVFHLVGGLLSAALQARDKHALAAMAPLLYTSSIVVGGLVGGQELGAFGFAWGVLVGSVLGPFGLPLIGCIRTGLHWKPMLRLRHPDLKKYLFRSLPIMLGWSIVVVDDWLLGRFGSLVGSSTIATLHYSKTLIKVPMGVFGLAAGVAAFPTLSRMVAQQKHVQAYELLSSSVKRMLVLALGSQVILTVAGKEIAMVIYGGKIPPDQYHVMGLVLAVMSIGLWGWSSQTVLSRGFYALGKTWEPTLIGTVVVVVTYPMYDYLTRRGTLGLAVSSSTAISLYCWLLVIRLRRYYEKASDNFGAFAWRMVLAVGAGIGAGLGMRWLMNETGHLMEGRMWIVVQGSLVGSVAFGMYVLSAFVLGVNEVRDVTAWMRSKINRKRAR